MAELNAFADAVEQEFGFLLASGFHTKVEDSNSIRCEHPAGVFVRVSRDPRDNYVGLRVGITSRPKDAVTDTEIVRLSGAKPAIGDYPKREDILRSSVARIAYDLRTYGHRALSGDTTILDEAMELRRQNTMRQVQPVQRELRPPGHSS